MKYVCLFCIVFILTNCATQNDTDLLSVETLKLRNILVAHRGFWDENVNLQNTTQAIRDTKFLGIWGSEIDIWETEDNYLVLSHDRIFHGIDLRANTFIEINKHLSEFGINIPTLEDALEEVMDSGNNLLIEIKHAQTQTLKKVIASYPELNDKIIFMSFNSSICESLIENGIKPVCLLLSTPEIDIDKLAEIGYNGIAIDAGALLHRPDLIDKCKTKGMTTFVWTVNNVKLARDFAYLNVDLIISDIPNFILSMR